MNNSRTHHLYDTNNKREAEEHFVGVQHFTNPVHFGTFHGEFLNMKNKGRYSRIGEIEKKSRGKIG